MFKPRERHQTARLELCEDPGCPACQLGQQLIEVLNDSDADVKTELLTLVRLIALRSIASILHPEDLPTLIEAIVGQIRDDVALLTGASKEVH